MELESKELNLAKSQEVILSDSKNFEESNKHKHTDENEAVAIKRQKLSEDNENLECLRNICETPLQDGTGSLPTTAQSAEQTDTKPSVTAPIKKKRKKKKSPVEAATKAKESKPKNEKAKGHMRKNIRDILKGDELEAETRAAQQREIERVQRLQQQQQQQHQIAECSYVPSFDEDDSTPSSTLVEDLQALAKELEDSTLSPEIPLQFLESNTHFNQSSHTADTVKVLY